MSGEDVFFVPFVVGFEGLMVDDGNSGVFAALALHGCRWLKQASSDSLVATFVRRSAAGKVAK